MGSKIHKSMNVVETLIQNSWILWIGTTKLILKNFIKLMFDYILGTSNPWKWQPTNWMILQWITRLYTECKIKIYKNSTAILTWTYLEMMQCKYIITDSRLLLGKTVYITQNEMIWTILIYITSLYTQSCVKMCYIEDQRWCIKSIILILNSCSNSIMKTPMGSKYW